MTHKISTRLVALAMLAWASAIVHGGAAAPELFGTADRCMACHNGLLTPEGEDASIGTDWRASMMANAARDPYWQAAVRREVLERPFAQAAIEDKCASCHMTMARFQAKAAGESGKVFAHLPIVLGFTPSDLLAADGVSCVACHQIQPDGLGTDESFTAGFTIDAATPSGQRKLFGPFEVDPGRTALMRSASRFVPEQGTHVRTSELCASCHTLYTHPLGPAGEVLGEFPEQVPYLEWRHSAFHDVRSCQSCHMPLVAGEMPISSVMGLPREAVSRHAFRGGNFFMPRILNRYRNELGVQALDQELAVASRRTEDHLETAAARVTIESLEVSRGRLQVSVRVENLAGHKLPTAYPSRRTWLHLTVHDANGTLVFESGRFNPDGSIAGNDNDSDASRFESHHEEIDKADQVQIYEAIMAGPTGDVTTVLLSAVRYVKDNRLLPDGFEKATAAADIAVRGRAAQDADFRDGTDRVRYSVDLAGAVGPLDVRAELWYQPIAYRWARNLGQQQAEEIQRFLGYYESLAGVSGTVLARDGATAP